MPDRNEAGQFVSPEPEGEAPDWSSLGDFDEVQNAVNMANQLKNLNTRHDALRQIYNEQYDSGVFQPVEQEQPDEWAHLRPQQPVEYEDQYNPQTYTQGVDPSQLPDLLAPVFDANNQRMWEFIQAQQAEQAKQQGYANAAQQAVAETGLPAGLAPLVKDYVTEQAVQYPNRQPGELAKEKAGQLLSEIRAMQVAAVQPPEGGAPPPPNAPIVGDAQPKNSEEAVRWMMDNLPPGP